MEIKINSDWYNLLSEVFEKEYFIELMNFVDLEYKKNPSSTFPEKELIFKAMSSCNLTDVKVVVLGQDPYPTKGHGNGLSFSVNSDVFPLPKSLKNIFKELAADLKTPLRESGNLEDWAKQGVLLLNNVLTVHEGEAGSHSNKGWEEFTSDVINLINKNLNNVVFILWGAKAQKKCAVVDSLRHFIIQSPHPSPLSSYRGFFGSKPFSQTNNYLKENNKTPIIW